MKRILMIVTLLVILGGSFLAAQDSSLITKEALQQRISELETGRSQAIANVHAFGAAIQECTYWLQRIEEAEKAKAEKKGKKDKKEKSEQKKEGKDGN